MKLTDFPREVSRQTYEDVIGSTVESLARQQGVRSVFQIGSVSNPGISDVDFFVVFDDDRRCDFNPRAGLSGIGSYLIMHGLFGSCAAHFAEVQRYSFFHNYHLLWGEATPVASSNLAADKIQVLKRQIAIEYLIKMYIDTVVEAAYGIVRVRGFLLHIKGILYDLDFLGVQQCALREIVEQVVARRDEWFTRPSSAGEIRDVVGRFNEELPRFIIDQLAAGSFYLPPEPEFRIADNMSLVVAGDFGFHHNGFRLPSQFGGLGRKYFNIQHRFNDFRFRVPARPAAEVPVLDERFRFLRRMQDYNREHLPWFMPAISSLPVV